MGSGALDSVSSWIADNVIESVDGISWRDIDRFLFDFGECFEEADREAAAAVNIAVNSALADAYKRFQVDIVWLKKNFENGVRRYNDEVLTGDIREVAFRWSDSVHERWAEVLGKDPDEVTATDMGAGLLAVGTSPFNPAGCIYDANSNAMDWQGSSSADAYGVESAEYHADAARTDTEDDTGNGLDVPSTDHDVHPIFPSDVSEGVCDNGLDAMPDVKSDVYVEPNNCYGWDVDFSCAVDPQTIENKMSDTTPDGLPVVVNLDPSNIIVVDGDTITHIDEDGTVTVYRFSAIDAAELEGDQYGDCWPDQHGIGECSDVNFGQKGKEFLEEIFYDAKSVQVVQGKLDQYGRRLGYFIVDGKSLLQCLSVREGLAWETVSYYGLGSHPELAQIVFDAALMVGDPNFEEPYLYKKNAQPCQ